MAPSVAPTPPPSLAYWTLWLIAPPQSSDATVLTRLISNLSEEYSTESFQPHLTVVSDIPLAIPIDEIAEKIKLCFKEVGIAGKDGKGVGKLRFEEVTKADTYYQNVFIRIDASPILRSLRSSLAEAFSLPPSKFMPHISLLYSTFTQDERQAVIDKLKAEGTVVSLSSGGLKIVVDGVSTNEVLAEGVAIVRTVGKADEWKVERVVKWDE